MPLDHVCGFYDISLCRGKPYQQVIYLIHLQLAGEVGFGLHNKTKQKSLPPVYHSTFTILA